MQTTEFSFDPLPEGFMLPKPVNSVKDEVILALERKGRLAITRKRDGYRVWAVRTHTWKLYTRGRTEVTSRFPHIVEELEKISAPYGTFFDGEMILEKDDKDSFPAVERFFKAKNSRDATTLQKEIGIPRFMIFDVVFWNGEKWLSHPWRDRYFKVVTTLLGFPLEYIFPAELINCSFKKAQEIVEQMDWEGLVLYDKEGTSDFRLDGKVARPRVAWKRKPFTEDDFMVRRWIPRENDPAMLKEMVLSQIDPETGKEIDCGKCGTGFSNVERATFANDNLYPLVVQVKFMERFASGKLRHPSFLRARDDKKPEECIFASEEKNT